MNGGDYSGKLRSVAVVWLLCILTYIIIRGEHVDDAQIVIGLVLGTITTLIVAQIGVQIARNGKA